MRRVFARAFLCDAGSDPDEVKARFQAANRGFMVQTSKADAAGNELLLEMLAAQTLKAEALGSLLAKKPEIDFLLRLAGTTQISLAIRHAGAHRGHEFLVVVAGDSEVQNADGVSARRLPRRELTRDELGRVERAAILNAKRP